eukprot:4151916-Amphidinium_carterae.1
MANLGLQAVEKGMSSRVALPTPRRVCAETIAKTFESKALSCRSIATAVFVWTGKCWDDFRTLTQTDTGMEENGEKWVSVADTLYFRRCKKKLPFHFVVPVAA